MRGTLNPFPDKLRNFFLWLKSKEFLVFLFFFLVSSAFWVMMAVKDTMEREIVIPVRMINVPKNVVITENIDQIRVTIRDNGYNIIGFYLDNDRVIEVNFHDFSKTEEGKVSVSSSELHKVVKSKLGRSAEILSIKPDKIEMYYNYGDYKIVPVKLYGSVTPADNYVLAFSRIKPDSVKVYASTSRLAKIDSVKTSYVRISDVSGQVTKVLSLQKISGVKFEPNNVTLETHAEVKVETTTEVPIRTINVPEGMVMRTFPPRVTVSYVVMESMAKSITEDDFSVVVDYNDLDTSIEQQSLPLRLMKAPNMAKRVKLPFTNVDYLLESN